MKRLHIFVEGQTEETFVKELLKEHLLKYDINVNAILFKTSKTGRGGVVNYEKIKHQIGIKCKEDQRSNVTTMIDLYGLPGNFPGIDETAGENDPWIRANELELRFSKDMNFRNFIPNLVVHEFEALLYSVPGKFSEWFDQNTSLLLEQERKQFISPEHINDNPETAPSKRILRRCPGYQKPLHGPLIALSIGLGAIRKECRHFDRWLEKLEDL